MSFLTFLAILNKMLEWVTWTIRPPISRKIKWSEKSTSRQRCREVIAAEENAYFYSDNITLCQ